MKWTPDAQDLGLSSQKFKLTLAIDHVPLHEIKCLPDSQICQEDRTGYYWSSQQEKQLCTRAVDHACHGEWKVSIARAGPLMPMGPSLSNIKTKGPSDHGSDGCSRSKVWANRGPGRGLPGWPRGDPQVRLRSMAAATQSHSN